MRNMKYQRKFTSRLLIWFEKNHRDFPWRAPGLSPYEILIAEILLQKTSSYKVQMVFQEFIRQFPSVQILSNASKSEIEGVIRPLGLQNIRSIGLKKVAKDLDEKYNGIVPNKEKDLRKLFGVGQYTVNATRCFAFDKIVPIIDVNAARVLGRIFFAENSDLFLHEKKSWEMAAKLIPRNKCKQYNWAILDFSSLICSFKPKCYICPMNDFCKDHLLGHKHEVTD